MNAAGFTPILDHLWQSTAFGGLMALAALALRKNRAAVRFWLWLVASMKFLVPCALLMELGELVRQQPALATTASPLQRWQAIQDAGQAVFTPSSAIVTATSLAHSHADIGFAVIAVVWICGFLFVAVRWLRQWRAISSLVRKAEPIDLGLPIPSVSAPARLEPGVFGIFRPVLFLPEGIAERLSPEQMQALFAHELCHVRRRDNLWAVVHVLVEAVFWFHPLVWWLGARMIAEREAACDEAVLQGGAEAETYATSVLEVCRIYLASPTPAIAGITGADLKQRVVHIVNGAAARDLELWKKCLLGVFGIAAVGLPLILGRQGSAQSKPIPQSGELPSGLPQYAVVSIKLAAAGTRMMISDSDPDGFAAHRVSLKTVLQEAYQIHGDQIAGGPDWIRSDLYSLDAKVDVSDVPRFRTLDKDQRRQMLQAALADRFHLKTHWETRDLPVFTIVVAKNGPKFGQTSKEDSGKYGGIVAKGKSSPGSMGYGPGFISGYGVSMRALTGPLSMLMGRTVIDRTGLTGRYDLSANWNPRDGAIQPLEGIEASGTPEDASAPSIFTAFENQLGLRLESQKAQLEVLVIDHAEKPSPN